MLNRNRVSENFLNMSNFQILTSTESAVPEGAVTSLLDLMHDVPVMRGSWH